LQTGAEARAAAVGTVELFAGGIFLNDVQDWTEQSSMARYRPAQNNGANRVLK
jgi:hypothetical protein